MAYGILYECVLNNHTNPSLFINSKNNFEHFTHKINIIP